MSDTTESAATLGSNLKVAVLHYVNGMCIFFCCFCKCSFSRSVITYCHHVISKLVCFVNCIIQTFCSLAQCCQHLLLSLAGWA